MIYISSNRREESECSLVTEKRREREKGRKTVPLLLTCTFDLMTKRKDKK